MAQVWCFSFLFLTSQSITTARFRMYTVSQRIWDSIFRKASKASQLWSNQIAELDIHKISQPWSLSQPPPKILRVFFGFWRFSIHDSIYGWSIIHFFDAIGMRWAIWPLAMTDPWCWYVNANKKGVFVDGIHGTKQIAAPWINGMDKYPQKCYWQKCWIIFTDLKQGFFLGWFPLDPFTHHR